MRPHDLTLKSALSVMAWMLLLRLAGAQAIPAAVSADPPPDAEHPARMQVVHIPTHGELINGVLYLPSGAGPHPVVILFRGLPGNETNQDLAQAIRRANWSVLMLSSRGSWGSPGRYSYRHLREDGLAAIEFVRDAHNSAQFALDSQRIVLMGHSTGGFVAVESAAATPQIVGLALISASDDANEAVIAHRSPS